VSPMVSKESFGRADLATAPEGKDEAESEGEESEVRAGESEHADGHRGPDEENE
jgi:hypothetical protein